MACCGRGSTTKVTIKSRSIHIAKPNGLRGLTVRRCPNCNSIMNKVMRRNPVGKLDHLWFCSRASCKYQEKI
jgi:uncharacterized protein with PIN domain